MIAPLRRMDPQLSRLGIGPSMTELDIWRSANVRLKRYGAEAVFIATRRAEALLHQRDTDGCLAWIEIAKTITGLERNRAGNTDPVHRSGAVHANRVLDRLME